MFERLNCVTVSGPAVSCWTTGPQATSSCGTAPCINCSEHTNLLHGLHCVGG
jgi:hypothetical protein